LHLVGSFNEIYITRHGSMKIKFRSMTFARHEVIRGRRAAILLPRLTSTFRYDELSISCSCRSTQREQSQRQLKRRLGGPRADLDALEKRKISCFCKEINLVSLVVQNVAWPRKKLEDVYN
jgi:uncharacterized protein YqjF (DUF2071 family)